MYFGEVSCERCGFRVETARDQLAESVIAVTTPL